MAKRKRAAAIQSPERSEDVSDESPLKKGRKGGKSIDKDNPFPEYKRPQHNECHAAKDGLAILHGEPDQPNADGEGSESENSILDSLVRTILSQNTTDTNSHRTFANLKKDFKDWEAVRNAPSAKVEAAIKLGGLAAVKTERIKEILNSVKEEQGSCSLEHLRKLPNEEIKAALLNFKGVGPKTAACVLMFSLGRHEFPVDTHVWRIAKNLGWVPKTATREQTYTHLNARIPDEIKFSLHVLMVEHGKRCERCAKNGKPRKESHGPCPLVNIAHAAGNSKKLSGKGAAKDAQHAISLKAEDIKEEASDAENEDGTVKMEESAEVKMEPKEESTDGKDVVKVKKEDT